MRTNPIHLTRAKALGLILLTSGLVAAPIGCKSKTANTPAPIIDANSGPDPALANEAPVQPGTAPTQQYSSAPSGSGYAPAPQPSRQVLGERQYAPAQTGSAEQYPEYQQQGQYANQQPNQNYQSPSDTTYDSYDAGQQALYADQAPPPLPVYEQPELTDPGDEWTPGYWNYADTGYYWVPGAWVAPPYNGALWTPGYWGYEGRRYRFHGGFWGLHIGFYGGVPYGFGYTGNGYEGGYWNQNHFYYNNAVNRVNINNVHNVYVRNVTVVNNTRISYNGPGGINARPTPSQLAVYHEQRTPPMQTQVQFARQASQNRQQFYAANHGQPAMAVAPQHIAAEPNIARPQPGFQPGQQRTPPNQPQINGQRNPQQQPNNPQQQRPGEPAQRNLQQPNNLQRPGEATQRNLQQPNNLQRPGEATQHNLQQQPNAQQRLPQQRPQEQPQQQSRPNQPQQNTHPGQQRQPAAPQERPVQPQQQPRPATPPQARPAQPQQARPTPAPAPQARPASPAPAPRPQPEARPAPAPAPRPAAPAPRPAAPAPRPAPAPAPRPAAPAPAAHPAEEGHPRR